MSVGKEMGFGSAVSIKNNKKSNSQSPVIKTFEREQMEED